MIKLFDIVEIVAVESEYETELLGTVGVVIEIIPESKEFTRVTVKTSNSYFFCYLNQLKLVE